MASSDPGAKQGFDLDGAIAGCILGTAVGDALGLAVEGLSAARQARMGLGPERYRFVFGRGMTSDDTEHTCMLAQALIVTAGSPPEHMPVRFARSLAWRLRFWLLGLPAGIGLATGRAIFKLWLGFPPASSGVRSAGNGPAMRSALLGVCYYDDLELMRALVAASTAVTHRDPDALDGALAIAVAAGMAARADGSVTPSAFARRLRPLLHRDSGIAADLERVVASVEAGASASEFAAALGCERGVSGYIRHTVPVVLHVWLEHQQDYRAVVQHVIRLGGDADTTAAIAGAVAGAHAGAAGLPRDLLDTLVEWPRSVVWMRKVAGRTSAAVRTRTSGRAVFLNPLAVLARNAAFLLLVLIHGFRRLAPPY